YFLPEDIKEQVAELWNQLGKSIRKYNAETIDNPFVDRISAWLQDLSDEDWETGALSVGVAIAGFHLVQAAGHLAAMLGAALAKKLAVGAGLAAALGKTFAVKVALPAIVITGIAALSMDDETRQNLLAQTGKSFRSF